MCKKSKDESAAKAHRVAVEDGSKRSLGARSDAYQYRPNDGGAGGGGGSTGKHTNPYTADDGRDTVDLDDLTAGQEADAVVDLSDSDDLNAI